MFPGSYFDMNGCYAQNRRGSPFRSTFTFEGCNLARLYLMTMMCVCFSIRDFGLCLVLSVICNIITDMIIHFTNACILITTTHNHHYWRAITWYQYSDYETSKSLDYNRSSEVHTFEKNTKQRKWCYKYNCLRKSLKNGGKNGPE